MLARRGRIWISQPVAVWRERVLSAPGAVEAPVGDVAIEAAHLPGTLHADPADRLIVATARLHGWRLATRDRRLLDYGARGHVNTIAA